MANILDPVRNFAIVTLSSGYNDIATSVVLVGGDGAKLPDPSTEGAFNVVWWNATDYANPSDDPNKEIDRVTARSTDTLTITRAQEGTSATTKNTAGKTYKMILAFTKKMRDNIEGMVDTDVNLTANSDLKIPSQKAVKTYVAANGSIIAPPNLLSNGNFINNSANGYGGTPDDWTNSNANPVQGGIPALTKQNLIDITGLATGDIELLLNLSGNFNDSSDNATNLTAGGSPTDDSDGLMGLAKKFVTGSSQYASVTAPNVLVGGNQTWAILVKPTALPGTSSRYNIFGHSDSAYGVQCGIELVTDAANVSRFNFQLSGTTTNTQVTSDIVVQANKWYFVVGIFDSTNSLLKIYVNGILKSVTASGTHTTSGTQTVGVGRAGSFAGNYSSALMNMAIMVSKALTDNQVKKLFAETLYKGIKVRRATTNAIAYQDLSMDLVERLRGKTVALRSDMYQEVASTSQISILQTLASGSTSETIISATDATTGSWLEKVATGAIDATAVGIRIQLKHSTSDGNTWFKKISLYEGSVLLPYDHSKKDFLTHGNSIINIVPNEIFSPVLLNSWVNFGSSFLNAGYWKDSFGVVHLQGMIKSGTSTANTFLFNLPLGYRPSSDLIFGISSNDVFGNLVIESGGVVRIGLTASSTYISLNGITFKGA